MPLARVPVTMTVSVMSAASMVIAALAVVEADAVVSASCASNIAGVQANGATIVDLISQLCARSFTHEKISLGFKFYSSPDAITVDRLPANEARPPRLSCTMTSKSRPQECELVLQFSGQLSSEIPRARGRVA